MTATFGLISSGSGIKVSDWNSMIRLGFGFEEYQFSWNFAAWTVRVSRWLEERVLRSMPGAAGTGKPFSMTWRLRALSQTQRILVMVWNRFEV